MTSERLKAAWAALWEDSLYKRAARGGLRGNELEAEVEAATIEEHMDEPVADYPSRTSALAFAVELHSDTLTYKNLTERAERAEQQLAEALRTQELQRRTEAMPKRGPNHLLHLILTILTAGLWAPIWILKVVLHSPVDKRYEYRDGQWRRKPRLWGLFK